MKHTDPLRVLFAASEVQPLVKTGGLADVSGALPPALRRAGVDARVLLPAYPGVIEQIGGEPTGGELRPLPQLRTIAKASFGFGDVNACIVFRKWTGA